MRLNTDNERVFDRIRRHLSGTQRLSDHAEPLMEYCERVIEEGNRKGVLAGTDKDGNPAPTLHYRPVTPGGRKPTVAERLGQHPRKKRGDYAGKGAYKAFRPDVLANNNLSSRAYRQLGGPYLAPRGQFSRIITNLMTAHGRDPSDPNVWFATGAWVEVVTVKGDRFLSYHFDGLVPGTDGAFDLRGIRPDDMKEIERAKHEWAMLTIREIWSAA